MNLEALIEIYNFLKDENNLPDIHFPKEIKKPFDPTHLEKYLKSKFDKSSVFNSFKELYYNEIIGVRPGGEYYIQGYGKKVYFIYWEKFKLLVFNNIA